MTTSAFSVGLAPERPGIVARFLASRSVAIAAVVAAILVVWYVGAIFLNINGQRFLDEQENIANRPLGDFILATWSQEKPRLPAPHQVAAEIWNTTVGIVQSSGPDDTRTAWDRFDDLIGSPNSLVFHAWVTLSSTLLGFFLGTVLGIGLAVLVVHVRSLDRSLMPWIVSSQTVPILAIAPMIIVVLAAVGLTGLLPKAMISTYLSFFPVTVGMVKGLRSPDPMHLDLMRTWNAGRWQVFWKLRWPASTPFLFVSMKIAIAASLVGAIVGELPTGAVAGLGARLLIGSYYSLTQQMWAALVAASLMAGVLIGVVGLLNRIVLRRMGAAGMSLLRVWQGVLAVVALAVAVFMPLVSGSTPIYLLGLGQFSILIALLFATGTLIALKPASSAVADMILFVAAHLGGGLALFVLPSIEAIAPGGEEGLLAHIGAHLAAAPGFWGLVVLDWLLAWRLVARLSVTEPKQPFGAWLLKVFVPLLFGVWLLFVWETAVRGFGVPFVLLPPPSAIASRIAQSTGLLTADFRQTFLKAVLAGYAIGSGAGFIVALVVDRVPFLKRGLLPIGNLASALPIIGIAPILVMWFGFDWQSKAAVVTVMTFFPMLVNTVAGLDAADQMQRDLMRTWAADHRQTVAKLRLPAALPFVFNGLKLNTTLAMIGAIVAEFFGTPIVGMGFRISTEVGRMNIDMVWAEIAVAAFAGSVFYGVMALVERACTFWHPSFRRQ